jgi:type III secretory pathway component EscS
MLVFVLLMLGGGMFGGILDTRWWERVRVGLGLTAERSWALDSVALAAFMALTLGVYGFASALASASAARWTTADVARAFVFSLVPLAAGFHLVHGFDHALEGVQLLVRLVSDPFGLGWDLFGTRTRRFDKPNPWVVWYVQLIVIVGAHVAGIWVAHVQAVTSFGARALALRSQVAMVAVMVLFTVSGLWILSRIPMVM